MTGPFTLSAAKRQLAVQFRAAGLDTPELDARLLVMAVTGVSHADLITKGDTRLSPDMAERLAEDAKRRLAGEPIDHILGYRDFYGRRFSVTKDVLSPRPETELLVEKALGIIKDSAAPRILDLGTGSGAIIISILAEHPKAEGVAVDLSEAALEIAHKNAKAHEVTSRLSLLQGHWFEPVTGKFDLILSNPPYITDAAMAELDTEVADYDPDMALRGGEDGLDAYCMIIREASAYLKSNGSLIFEIGYDQGAAVSSLLHEVNFSDISLTQDLAGHDRVITAVI